MRSEVTSVRLAELVATLSFAADLGLGQPMQHSTPASAASRRPASNSSGVRSTPTTLPPARASRRARVVDRRVTTGDKVKLEDAQIVVSGGRGLDGRSGRPP
jgi:electron transfer flavoprotein alpha subunit